MRGILGRWRSRGGDGPPPAAGAALVDRVLAVRGIRGEAAARPFLDPRLTDLHDPSRMTDLDRAARRLLDAAAAGPRQPIVIYGDYDVDGITATAILFHVLKAIEPGADVRTYVPHRLDEGYGLNSAAIEELAAGGAKVIVTVDCGVTAAEPAAAARRAGVDLIITDHHNAPEHEADLPGAYAVVHPRRPGSGGTPAYPFGDLSGSGVAYKVAWRLATMAAGTAKVSAEMRSLLIDLLALASLGVVADVVPLIGENRVIARYGLGRIASSRFAGLRALVEASGLAGERVDAAHVGFRLGPRLNACGRMGHAREAVELLTTSDAARAAEIAAALTRQNQERQAVERAILEQAAAAAEAAGMTAPGRRAIVLADERWHAGVVGIVCSRLVERFCRPAILMCRRDGVCHGSGRSVEGFNLHGALAACGEWLERYGGHDMAAGVQVAESRLEPFTEAFIGHANSRIPEENLVPTVRFDCEAGLGELTLEAVESLESLAPFGRGNPEVRVLLRGLVLASTPQPMGAHGRHVSLQVRAGGGREAFGGVGPVMRLVGWGWGEHRERLRPGMSLDAVVEPKVNRWNGRVSVEGELCDVALRGVTE